MCAKSEVQNKRERCTPTTPKQKPKKKIVLQAKGYLEKTKPPNVVSYFVKGWEDGHWAKF